MKDISSLINFGYTAADILGKISLNNLAFGKKVGSLMNYGYSAAKILSHLAGDKDEENYFTLEEKLDAQEKKSEKNRSIAALGALVALAGGVGLLARGGAGAAAGALGQALPSQDDPSNPPPDSPPPGSSPVMSTAQPLPVSPAQQAIINRLPEQKMSPEDIPIKRDEKPSLNAKTDFSFKEKDKEGKGFYQDLYRIIEKHKGSGKTPEETLDVIQKSPMYSPVARRIEAESGQPFLETIKDVYGSTEKGIGEKQTASSKKGSRKSIEKEAIDNLKALKDAVRAMRKG